MYLSQQPNLWSAQLGPSLTNSYDERQQFDTRTTNPEGASHLRSPIPPDPGYGKDLYAARCASRRPPRLHGSDAKQIYKRAVSSAGIPYLLHLPCYNLFYTTAKPKKPSKNYLNKNVKQIQRIMQETHQRQANKEQQLEPTPVKALWHSKQYDHVESKVKQKLEENTTQRSKSSQGNYLRAHENTGAKILRSQSAYNSRSNSVASSVNLIPTQINDKIKSDYVKLNSQYIKHIPKARKSISTEAVEKVHEKQEKQLKNYQNKQKGRVPNYIEKIKEKRDQDNYEAYVNGPDPDCPTGHIKVDNNQRISTLQQLHLNRTELEKRLSHLPVRNDTLMVRRTKEEIEKKIIELDEAIQIFSKPKVFLKIEE